MSCRAAFPQPDGPDRSRSAPLPTLTCVIDVARRPDDKMALPLQGEVRWGCRLNRPSRGDLLVCDLHCVDQRLVLSSQHGSRVEAARVLLYARRSQAAGRRAMPPQSGKQSAQCDEHRRQRMSGSEPPPTADSPATRLAGTPRSASLTDHMAARRRMSSAEARIIRSTGTRQGGR